MSTIEEKIVASVDEKISEAVNENVVNSVVDKVVEKSDEDDEHPLPKRPELKPIKISAAERLAQKQQELKELQDEIAAAAAAAESLTSPSKPKKEKRKSSGGVKEVEDDAPITKRPTPNSRDEDDDILHPIVLTIFMDCPQHKVGGVIGKKGAVINHIIEKSGCKVEIDKTRAPEGHPQPIRITGEAHQLPVASMMINEIINAPDEQKEADDGVAPLTVNMGCPQERIGGVIGKKGSVIAEITRKSGCRIEIDKTKAPEGRPQNILLTGKIQQIATAQALINEIINSPDERRGGGRDDDRDRGGRRDDRNDRRDDRDGRRDDRNDRDSGRGSHRGDRDNFSRDSRESGNRSSRVPDKDREPDFLCPVDKIGMVIGPKGANVNDIFSRTGCKVQVEHDLPLVRGTDRIISFKGNASQIALAKAMVRVVIATPDAPGYIAAQGKPPQQQQQQNITQVQPTMYQQTAQMGAMPSVTYGPFGATMAYNPYPNQMAAAPQQFPQMPNVPTSSLQVQPQQQMFQMSNGQMMYAAAPQQYGMYSAPLQQQPQLYAPQQQQPQLYAPQQQYGNKGSQSPVYNAAAGGGVGGDNSPVYGMGSHAAQMQQYSQYQQQQTQTQGQQQVPYNAQKQQGHPQQQQQQQTQQQQQYRK